MDAGRALTIAYTSYDTDTSTGDTHAEFAAATKANIEAADLHHLGTSEPATGLANGRIWADSNAATYILKLRQGGAWVSLMGANGSGHFAHADLDMDGNEVKNLQIEQVGTLATPAAGTESQIEYESTQKQLALTTDTDNFYLAMCNTDATTVLRIPCAFNVATLGTPATANTSTIMGGWQLDAAAEELNIVALQPIPNGWTTADDLTLEVDVLLLNAETNGDDIDFDGEWIAMSDGDGPGKTVTAMSAITHDIGSNSSQYDRHRLSLTIDHDDATNPVAVGDNFVATVNHDATGEVAGVIVVAAYLAVPVFNYAG